MSENGYTLFLLLKLLFFLLFLLFLLLGDCYRPLSKGLAHVTLCKYAFYRKGLTSLCKYASLLNSLYRGNLNRILSKKSLPVRFLKEFSTLFLVVFLILPFTSL